MKFRVLWHFIWVCTVYQSTCLEHIKSLAYDLVEKYQPLVKIVYQKNNFLISRTRKRIFLFLNQNICCGYSKEPSRGDESFEHPKHMLKLMGKKMFKIYARIFVYLNL